MVRVVSPSGDARLHSYATPFLRDRLLCPIMDILNVVIQFTGLQDTHKFSVTYCSANPLQMFVVKLSTSKLSVVIVP